MSEERPDIVERLRVWPATYGEGDAFEAGFVGQLMRSSADEIERLRADLTTANDVAFRNGAAAMDLCNQIVDAERAISGLHQYSTDIRRNASGGDDYPWDLMRGVADEIDRHIAPFHQEERGE